MLYVRAIGLIVTGTAWICFGIKYLKEMCKAEDELRKIEGVVTDISYDNRPSARDDIDRIK
jgi:hypothetical protein